MYLALLPDAESLAALKRFAPSVSDDAHLTVIHSKANPRPLALPTWAGSLMLSTKSVASFSGRNKVPVLTLTMTEELRTMREQAECFLREAGLPCSTSWPFVPHVTLHKPPTDHRFDSDARVARFSRGKYPETLRFDRMEWR